jgi:hypothetical protein
VDVESVFLGQGEERVVRWLDQLGGGRAHSLAQGLLDRDLFKRALVTSRSGGGGRNLDWDRVLDVYGRVGRNWQLKWQVNKILEQFVLGRLRERTTSTVTALAPTSLSRVEEAARKGPVVLVDYPPGKPGAGDGEELVFLREGGLNGLEASVLSRVEHEVSPVWKSIQRDSRDSLAKLRVFCHASLHEPIRAAFETGELERAVTDAIIEAQARANA